MGSRWILIASLCAAAACGGGEREAGGAAADTDREPVEPGGGGPSAQGSSVRFEVTWMNRMVPHHEDAVGMAEACLQAGVRPELATFCEVIRTAQTTEIGWMIGWLQEWYGGSYAGGDGVDVGGMGMGGADLGPLRGAQFERAFLGAMIPHHAMAVHMSRPCVARATHAELAQLCASIIATQSAEIARMQGWRCEWFGACGAGGGGGVGAGGGRGPGAMGPGRR